ncbi:hypothetical protein Lalb_Chr06g0161931 [Lupinus albus]|uniref:Uncharacterized protein n=1 Tax=Lupinus albus TaxID=3870 RepID=A0A6A4QAX2_LUPAL|nr:hypothetical protein Lalb_Chr06g0161931 [Lupinus albus]
MHMIFPYLVGMTLDVKWWSKKLKNSNVYPSLVMFTFHVPTATSSYENTPQLKKFKAGKRSSSSEMNE